MSGQAVAIIPSRLQSSRINKKALMEDDDLFRIYRNLR